MLTNMCRAGIYLTEFRHAPHQRRVVATIL